MLKTHLAAGVQKTETPVTLYCLPTGKNRIMRTFDGRPQDNTSNLSRSWVIDRDELFSAVTYTHVTSSGTKRSDHGLSLSRDRRSIVFDEHC